MATELKKLTVDASNGTFTFEVVDAEAREAAAEALKAAQSGGSGVAVSSVEPAEDDIPKVFFGGALQQTKDEKVVPFRYISKTDDFGGYAEIKAQGNSSMSYPKKNQTVKLFKDEACTEKLKVDFKGWGKQNKHVYKANWIDISHARNVVSARLWADVVKSRANYADLPELLRTSPNQGAVDGFPVKVYADGIYQGRYTLNIPKDKWAFNMDDGLDNHCVLCGENYVSGCFRASAKIDETDWSDEIHDTVPESIKTRWNEVISFVMNSTDEEFRANLSQYFFVDSLIDYYLFGLASCGLDAFGKNQIYATYDGQKWIASMYDMDSTWGLWWNGSSFVTATYGRNEFQDFKDGGQGNLLYIRLEQLFYTEIQTRWAELRNGVLTIENIINRFERFTDIAPAELVEEDYAITTADGAFTNIPSKTVNYIHQIRKFARERLAFADDAIAKLNGEQTEPDPEQPDNPDEPDVPDNPVDPNNLLSGVSWHVGEVSTTGEIKETVTAANYTEVFDVSEFAGTSMDIKCDCTNKNWSRMVIFDENMAVIGCSDTTYGISYATTIPSNAKYARISIYGGAGKTVELLGGKGDFWKTLEIKDGAYPNGAYNPNDSGSKHIRVPVTPGEKLIINYEWGVAFLGAGDEVLRFDKNNDISRRAAVYTAPDGAEVAAVCSEVSNLSSATCSRYNSVGSGVIE